MTADVPMSQSSGHDVRDQLAEALRDRQQPTGDRERDYCPGAPCMDCGDYPGLRHDASDCPRAVTAALLPVVTAYGNQRAAQALTDAADMVVSFWRYECEGADVHDCACDSCRAHGDVLAYLGASAAVLAPPAGPAS